MGVWLFGRSGTSGRRERAAREGSPRGEAGHPGGVDGPGRAGAGDAGVWAVPDARDGYSREAPPASAGQCGGASDGRGGRYGGALDDGALALTVGAVEGRGVGSWGVSGVAGGTGGLGTLADGAGLSPSAGDVAVGIRRCPVCRQWYHATAAHPGCPWCSEAP